MNTKQIEIGDKTYILTVTRGLSLRMAKVAPEFVKMAKKSNANLTEEEEFNFAVDYSSSIYDNMDVLFYEMIKIHHKNISKETSDKIYLRFCEEYNDVDSHLLAFFRTSFTDGIPRENKKTINW